MCYRTGKYTVCRRVRAAYSPDILQAGVVKGLNLSSNLPACSAMAGPKRTLPIYHTCEMSEYRGIRFKVTASDSLADTTEKSEKAT